MTYDITSGNSRDKVRLLITDTDASSEVFSDDEVDEFISLVEAGNVYFASALALDVLANAYARKGIYYSLLLNNIQIDKRQAPKMLREGATAFRKIAHENLDVSIGITHLPYHVDRNTGEERSDYYDSSDSGVSGMDNYGNRYSHNSDVS